MEECSGRVRADGEVVAERAHDEQLCRFPLFFFAARWRGRGARRLADGRLDALRNRALVIEAGLPRADPQAHKCVSWNEPRPRHFGRVPLELEKSAGAK